MKKYLVLVFIFSMFYFNAQNVETIRFGNTNSNIKIPIKPGDNINKDLNVSVQKMLIKQNYFKKEINYFSLKSDFTSEEERLKYELKKPFVKSLFEGYINLILNNKNK